MRRLLFAAVIAVTSLAACSKSDKADSANHENLPEMTVDEVAAAIEAKQLTAIDCNSERTRKKIGTLPGAILVDEETFTAADLPADKAAKLVFYCGGPG